MRKKLGELLVEAGATTPEEVRRALAAQAGPKAGKRLGEILLAERKISSEALAKALAVQFELPFARLPALDGPASKIVPVDVQVQHRVVVFKVEAEGKVRRLHLALADPTQKELVDELQFQLAMPVRVHLVTPEDLERALAAIQHEGLETVAGEPLEPKSEAFELTEEVELTPVPAVPTTGPVDLPSEWADPAPPTEKVSVVRFDARAKGETEELPEVDVDLTSRPPVGPKTSAPPAPRTSSPAAAVAAQVAAGTLRVTSPSFGLPPLGGAPTPLRAGPGAAAALSSVPRPLPAAAPERLDFSDADLKVLDSLEKMARGEPAPIESEKVKPAQMVASLIRLLIKKGVIQELEFLEELSRK